MTVATDVQEEALKKELSAHRLIVSPIGVFKILAVVLFLVGPIISLATEVCSAYTAIVIVSLGVVEALLYISSALGLAKRIPNIWIKLDITCCVLFAATALTLSIITISNCSSDRGISVIPGVLGIIGSLSLFFAAAALFVVWLRSKNIADASVQSTQVQNTIDPKRKSVMI